MAPPRVFLNSFVYYESIAKNAGHVNVFILLCASGLNINTCDASWIGQKTTQLSGKYTEIHVNCRFGCNIRGVKVARPKD